MPESRPLLFVAVCLAGASSLVYFAQSSALESLPAYSTLSTRPDGAKLLFDGLRETDLVQVSRQFKSIELQKPKNAAVFFLGMQPYALEFNWSPDFADAADSASSGNRLIIAAADASKYPDRLVERWGIRLGSAHLRVDKNWRPLPEMGVDVWQRTFGKGDIILVGNAERLTNKGVAKDPANRQLLARLLVGHPSAVFEEAHLGINETGSLAGLARHYHLQGLIAGLVLLAALFIWSRSVSFPPLRPHPERSLLGADANAMLVELMSRHLKGQIIATCVAEWNRTRGHAAPISQPETVNAVAAYGALQESLQQKTKFTI